MKLFYCETGVGCCLMEAINAETARSETLAEVGMAHGVKLVRLATDADIAWVSGMGGWLPESAKKRLEGKASNVS